MPRIRPLTTEDKVLDEVAASTDKLDWELHRNRISYTKIAKMLNITPAAVSIQFRRKSISYPVYVAAKMLLEERV